VAKATWRGVFSLLGTVFTALFIFTLPKEYHLPSRFQDFIQLVIHDKRAKNLKYKYIFKKKNTPIGGCTSLSLPCMFQITL